MAVAKYDCYGGPIDGQNLPAPDNLPAFGTPDYGSMLIHMDCFGRPHFYEMVQHIDAATHEVKDVLEYRGSDPDAALQRVYAHDPEMATALAQDLKQIMRPDCDPENFDSDNIVGWCREPYVEEEN